MGPLRPPLGGKVTNIQSVLNFDDFKTVDYKVVRLNYVNPVSFRAAFRVVMNPRNAYILTVVFLHKTIRFNPDIEQIKAFWGFGLL